jgi:hypothetical protein
MQSTPEQYLDAARLTFAAYPTLWKNKQDVDDYAYHLQDCEQRILARAVTHVTDFYPAKMPTAAELKTLAHKLERDAIGAPPGTEPAPYMGEPAHLSDDNPFEQLAQKMERGGMTGAQCARELRGVMAGNPIAQDLNGDPFDFKMAAAGDQERDDG